jgi:hypothetical protein
MTALQRQHESECRVDAIHRFRGESAGMCPEPETPTGFALTDEQRRIVEWYEGPAVGGRGSEGR